MNSAMYLFIARLVRRKRALKASPPIPKNENGAAVARDAVVANQLRSDRRRGDQPAGQNRDDDREEEDRLNDLYCGHVMRSTRRAATSVFPHNCVAVVKRIAVPAAGIFVGGRDRRRPFRRRIFAA